MLENWLFLLVEHRKRSSQLANARKFVSNNPKQGQRTTVAAKRTTIAASSKNNSGIKRLSTRKSGLRNKKHNEIGNELAQTLEDRATRLARAAIIQQRLLCHRCDQAKFDCARGPVDLARQLTQAVIEKPNVVAVRLAFDGRRSVAAYRHRSCSLIDGDR